MSDLSVGMSGRVGILLNPNSGRIRARRELLRRLAADVPGVDLHETPRAEDLASALRSMPAATTELLVVMGGDGTLQAVLTALLRKGSALPPLLVIPAGTTNMSAADLGARRRPQAALRALARWRRGTGPAPASCQRAALCVDRLEEAESTAGREAEYGLFFGAGAIHSGVHYFQRRVRAAGVRGMLGPALTFGYMLLTLLRSRPHPLLPPSPARLDGDSASRDGDWLLVLVSTLDRLLFGSHPYWGVESAPLHFTAVEHRPRRLLRTLVPVLCGRGAGNAREGDGYISQNLHALTLDGIRDYVIDGECYQAGRGLRITATRPLSFLTF